MPSCCSLVLFYCSPFSDLSLIQNSGLLVMFHFWLLCLLCPITVLLSFRFVDTFIPMDTYMNKSCMIGSVHILTIVHPFARNSSLSVFSVFSGVLQNTIVNSVNSVTLKFGTTRSWGGATHKLKPSPFRQLRFSGPTPCSVPPLDTPYLSCWLTKLCYARSCGAQSRRGILLHSV